MRKFIRHPSSVPVRIRKIKSSEPTGTTLVNVSYGGLALHFPEYIGNGTKIELFIDVIDPRFNIRGVIVWCHQKGDGFELGIRFQENDDVFQMRMIEQVCHIEDYRSEVQRTEGRTLSSEEAAAEWIEKYAGTFPGIGGNPG